MDYFQGVVTEFLRANRSTFVNTEFCVQLDAGKEPLKGRHWYCDAVAANFEYKTIYLCEVTYSKTLHALISRLQLWNKCWPELCEAIIRDCHAPKDWNVQPWLFIPNSGRTKAKEKLSLLKLKEDSHKKMPYPWITDLEKVVPWEYSNWNRQHILQENDA